ncbi:hypothetical protein Csp1_13190 [Corynebacterium provencense]|uniref:Uncharacterized protein n=1 Tax=Corynebacterium provencense TaxID=1737425 RepID=A0A2Z3YNJ8_9CORY|nr:hypothetical protein Csp1_13190 [Corynebacterium provencense]
MYRPRREQPPRTDSFSRRQDQCRDLLWDSDDDKLIHPGQLKTESTPGEYRGMAMNCTAGKAVASTGCPNFKRTDTCTGWSAFSAVRKDHTPDT